MKAKYHIRFLFARPFGFSRRVVCVPDGFAGYAFCVPEWLCGDGPLLRCLCSGRLLSRASFLGFVVAGLQTGSLRA
jgi:hypothetical protein